MPTPDTPGTDDEEYYDNIGWKPDTLKAMLQEDARLHRLSLKGLSSDQQSTDQIINSHSHSATEQSRDTGGLSEKSRDSGLGSVTGTGSDLEDETPLRRRDKLESLLTDFSRLDDMEKRHMQPAPRVKQGHFCTKKTKRVAMTALSKSHLHKSVY